MSAASRPRLVLLSLILFAASAVAAAIVYMRSAPDPAQSVRRAWARHGVDKPNVVLITLDTTRADHLGSYGHSEARTPATDALASAGVRFTHVKKYFDFLYAANNYPAFFFPGPPGDTTANVPYADRSCGGV